MKQKQGWRVGKSPLNLSIADLRSYLSYITYHRLICICMPESLNSTQRSRLTAVSSVELRGSGIDKPCFILVEEYPVPKAHYFADIRNYVLRSLQHETIPSLNWFTCWCIFIQTHIHMYTCIHICMYVCMYVCMEYMFTCMYALEWSKIQKFLRLALHNPPFVLCLPTITSTKFDRDW